MPVIFEREDPFLDESRFGLPSMREDVSKLVRNIFGDTYVVTIFYGSKKFQMFVSSCVFVLVPMGEENAAFFGRLEDLREVTYTPPRFLQKAEATLTFADTAITLQLLSDDNEPPLVTRLREEIWLRQEAPVPFVCGFAVTPSREDIVPLSVSLYDRSGKYAAALAELLEDATNVVASSVSFPLHVLLQWDVASGDYVYEGQPLGMFADTVMKAPATGRIWITAPPNTLENWPDDGPSSLVGFLPSPVWIDEQNEYWDLRSILEHPQLSHSWNVALIEQQSVPIGHEFDRPRVMQTQPEHGLIRHPADAERAAAAWMRYWGWIDAQETGPGTDEGKDVVASDAVAQVKAHMNPIGRPDLQNLYGVASAEGNEGLFFALMGYTKQALDWADQVNLPLFRFDRQGIPEPVNQAAIQVLRQKQEEWRSREQDDEDEVSWAMNDDSDEDEGDHEDDDNEGENEYEDGLTVSEQSDESGTVSVVRQSLKPQSVTKELVDLVALHREGALTDEEFAAAKAKLLS